MAFIFYDIQTNGTDTSFDQILQFAAIKTDDDLNALDSFNVRCRLLPPCRSLPRRQRRFLAASSDLATSMKM
jgi:hypothetical protein